MIPSNTVFVKNFSILSFMLLCIFSYTTSEYVLCFANTPCFFDFLLLVYSKPAAVLHHLPIHFYLLDWLLL